jgi:molybdate transport system ATP-binding protein
MTRIAGEFRLARGGFQLDTRFELPGPGVTALCGPSGAGKTSFLRCVAGLERPQSGELEVAGERWFDAQQWLPAHRRPLGYVTQEPNLFPHLDVLGNLRYGLRRMRRATRIQERDIIDGLGLEPLLPRDVSTLSGGERQRVAIGRALMRSPVVLLMDEPVSALDVRTRAVVLKYIEQVLEHLQVRCLYVSHDLKEAAKLADELLWMESGRIVAQGAPQTVLTDLRLPFAEQEDAECVLNGVVEAHEPDVGLSRIRCAGGLLWLPQIDAPVGADVPVQIAARDVSIAVEPPGGVSILNVLQGIVEDIAYPERWPAQALVRIDVGDGEVLARITRKSVQTLELRAGARVWALVKAVAIAS